MIRTADARKTSLAFSLAFHLSLLALLAFAPGRRAVLPSKEIIIPVNIVSLPAPLEERLPPPEESPLPVQERPPKQAQVEPRPLPPLSPRDIVVPDLVSKIEAPAPPSVSLKDKVQTRIKGAPPAPRETAVPRETPPAKEAAGPREAAKPEAYPVETARAAPGAPAVGLTLQAVNFPYAWYISIVQTKIYENWSPPQRLLVLTPGTGTYVRFIVRRDGSVADIRIQQPSGYTILDRSSLEAVKGVSELPPLPPEYPEKALHVVVFFQPTLP